MRGDLVLDTPPIFAILSPLKSKFIAFILQREGGMKND